MKTWFCSLVAFTSVLVVLNCVSIVDAQGSGGPIRYPGYPNGDFSPVWQSCRFFLLAYSDKMLTTRAIEDFEVTEPLPNITFDIGRSFAGNIPVQRGHNLSLFYWAVEKENGSLTAGVEDATTPWQIWLNGGPGSSSLIGFFLEVRILVICFRPILTSLIRTGQFG